MLNSCGSRCPGGALSVSQELRKAILYPARHFVTSGNTIDVTNLGLIVQTFLVTTERWEAGVYLFPSRLWVSSFTDKDNPDHEHNSIFHKK